MVTIEVNNAKCKITGDIKVINQLDKAFSVKHPNAYFIRVKGFAQDNWDGKIHYITEHGYFKTGLLTQIYNHLVKLQVKVKLVDHRLGFDITPKIPKKIGNFDERGYQFDAVKAVLENNIGGINLPIGTINAATNAGKTAIMAMVYLAYKRKIPALILINDGDLFEQFKKEIPELVGDDFGYVRGKDAKWNKFTICMVQTVSQKISLYKHKLQQYGIVMVDEADLGDNKTYKTVLQNCSNANVRIGLSGTIYLSKLKKDFVKNQNLHSFFGEELFKITKLEMKEKGHSAEVVVRMFRGSEKIGIKGDWKAEYDKGITYNEDRAMLCVERLKANIKLKRLPALVICQFHNHVELMEKIFQRELGKKYKIRSVHHKTKDRKKIMLDFRAGKIDILISTFIIKRGKNFPLTKYLLNAAGSDSQETVWQIMGRLERKDASKKKSYMEDFYDEGVYLSRHSKHRLNYYHATGFRVIKKF